MSSKTKLEKRPSKNKLFRTFPEFGAAGKQVKLFHLKDGGQSVA